MLASSIPAKFTIPWANAAGSSYIRSIPTPSQIGVAVGAASLTDGFPPWCFAAGGWPDGRDVQGIFNWLTQWQQWEQAGGPVGYDSAFQTAISGYPKGAVIASATTFGVWWLNTVDANTTNPDTGGAGWVTFAGNGPYYAPDTGTANALAISVPAISALAAGQIFIIKKSAAPNTLATTLKVNGLGVTALVWADGTALVAGDWPASVTGLVEYDGTQFNLLSVMGPSVFARSISAATRTFSTSASTPQALANNTATTYNNFSTSSVDFGSMAASAFTFSKAGVYAVFVGSGQSITYTGTTNTAYSTTLFKNGTAVPNASSNNGSYGGSPGGSNQTVFTVITANAGDTVASVTFVLNAYYTGGNIVSAAINITRLF